jgi:hypothetical protein
MAITDVTRLEGKAEVLGTQRPFFWDGARLIVGEVSYTDATNILDALASGRLWDVRPPVNGHIAAPAVQLERPNGKTPATAALEIDAAEFLKPEKGVVPTSPEARPGELALNDSKPTNGALDHAIVSSDSLLKALTLLVAKGFKDWKTLTDECERIRADVPVLKKISGDTKDFRDRILRVSATKLQMSVPDDAA